ncbi:hypothetical protein ACROYT_G021464 [Oculina patagonica]
MQTSMVVFFLAWFRLVTTNEESDDEIHFTNSWAVHIDNGDLDAVNNIAQKHGFINQGQIGSLPGYYHFVKHSVRERSRRSLDDHSETLLSEPRVKWVEQQRILERSKRDIIPGEDELVQRSVARLRRDTAVTIRDPFFKDQWYLQNIGQSSGPTGVDINVLPVWARGYSGKGVVVSVLDDGIDHTHPDLKNNYDPDASFDFNDFDGDPKPRDENLENCHGTKCAGEVAAQADNGICGVGVSFNASIGGIRMLDGKATDTVEGSSLSYRSDYIDIYSCCWGPKDDGKRFGKPGYLATKALQIGAERGRGGKGNIYVWATGNGGLTDDDCNCDGYTTSIYTISIGAISDHGLSTYYTETCASTLAVTFSGGSHRETVENKVVTTDLHHKCTEVFKGTSSAAPLAAGMLALVLEANPKLTWRDVQHIIVESSQVTSPLDEGWKTNGAGKRYNHKFGFGRLDVSRMVDKALKWKNVDRQRICHGAAHNTTRFIPASGSLILSANTSACSSTASEIRRVEHVQLNVTLQHRHRGDISITLISPSGTRSKLLTTRRNDHSARGLKNWVFMTVHCWGEDPRGLWTVIVTDNDNNNREHYLEKLTQGDEEDVTRIFLDDTGKQRQKETGQLSSKKDHAHDHIFKTMEDTAGKIFKESKFTKFAHGEKSQHFRNKSRVKVSKKKVSKENPSNGLVKHHDKKVMEGKMAHLKKHYFKTKTNSKTKMNKGKQSWTKKKLNPNTDVDKVKQSRKMSKKHTTTKKITSKTVLSQKHEKLKATFKKHDSEEKRKKPHKASKQDLNATFTVAQKLATTSNKNSSADVSDLSRSQNATRTLGLISELISEIQKNPLVTKIALEALKNPAIGNLFGIDSFRDATEAIKERMSPTKSKKQQTEELKNGTEINGSGTDLFARVVDRGNTSNATGVNDPTNLFKMIRPDKSTKHERIQFFKIIKDTEEERKYDVSGSGVEGSGSSGSGYHFDGSAGSGNRETLQVANSHFLNCGGSSNCTKTNSEDSPPSVLHKSPSELENEADNSYEIFDEDEKESQYGEGDGEDIFEDGAKPVKSVEDSDDLIPEFGFDLKAFNEHDSDLCSFSADLNNASSVAAQKARCAKNGTIEKRDDERDKEDKNLAHYLAVDKLKSSSGDFSLDSGDDQDGSSSKSLNDNPNSDDDNSDAKYNSKDLEVLQEALEDQLSRLSKDPASQKSNKEILARVRDDIKRGDIDDLELLEAQITDGKTDISRVIRSTTPEDEEINNLDDDADGEAEQLEGYNSEDEDLERRRVSRKAVKEKLSQTYYVDPDKYGKVNSGILESWTLILYGTK